MNWTNHYAYARSALMGRRVVSISQLLAAQAGLRVLQAGGNAVDAAIATAMALAVVEPTGCGPSSDAIAVVWDGKELHGLNDSGRSPAAWSADRFNGQSVMLDKGWDRAVRSSSPGKVTATSQGLIRAKTGRPSPIDVDKIAL